MFAAQTTADVQNQIQILTKRKASAVHEDDYERAEAIKKEISALRAQLEKGKDDGTTGNGRERFMIGIISVITQDRRIAMADITPIFTCMLSHPLLLTRLNWQNLQRVTSVRRRR